VNYVSKAQQLNKSTNAQIIKFSNHQSPITNHQLQITDHRSQIKESRNDLSIVFKDSTPQQINKSTNQQINKPTDYRSQSTDHQLTANYAN
jgi:hypothetical protein